MQVLVIEDEPQSLDGMKRIMGTLDARIRRSFFCSHAAEALEVIEQHRPELIVTDIILPDMTGLELLESIRLDQYEPKIIIVSGFDNFEYAKRGLKLGAVDYFLKPFDTELFLRKIVECLDWIEEERRERQEHHRAVELAHLGTRSMRDLFLLGLCLQQTALQEHIVHRLRTWELEWLASASYRVAAIAARPFSGELAEKEEDVLSFATGNVLEELLREQTQAVAFMNAKKYWIVIVPARRAAELAERIGRDITKYVKQEACLGLSDEASSLQSVHAAYRQAVDSLRAALLSKNRNVYYYEELKEHALSTEEEIKACMLGSVVAQDDEGMREAAAMFVGSLVMKGRAVRPADISQRCMDWVLGMQDAIRRSAGLGAGEMPVALWDELDECESMDDVSRAIGRYFSGLSAQIRAKNKNSIVEQAMKLIGAAFTQDIRLQAIADELAIHPVWLSQLFKKETGEGFLEYVTDLRIRRAKELLRDSSLKIYEIAESVGYADVHYFGKLFKRKTGQTPKEYRYGK